MNVEWWRLGRRGTEAGLLRLLAVTSFMPLGFAEETSHRVPTGGGRVSLGKAAEALTSQALAEALNGDVVG